MSHLNLNSLKFHWPLSKAVSCFTTSKKSLFREFCLKERITTELRKLLDIFQDIFEEYKRKFSLIKLWNMADLSADSWGALT